MNDCMYVCMYVTPSPALSTSPLLPPKSSPTHSLLQGRRQVRPAGIVITTLRLPWRDEVLESGGGGGTHLKEVVSVTAEEKKHGTLWRLGEWQENELHPRRNGCNESGRGVCDIVRRMSIRNACVM